MLTSVDVPEDLMQLIDAIVAERKKAKNQVTPLTEAQRAEGLNIARTQGVAQANAYYLNLQNPMRLPSSRGAVICALLRVGLDLAPPVSLSLSLPASSQRIYTTPPNTRARALEEKAFAQGKTYAELRIQDRLNRPAPKGKKQAA